MYEEPIPWRETKWDLQQDAVENLRQDTAKKLKEMRRHDRIRYIVLAAFLLSPWVLLVLAGLRW